MSDAEYFTVAALSAAWIPVLIPLAIMLVGLPRHFMVRCCFAVVAGWAFSALFVPLVYNPIGIAAGHASGEHFPERLYDNNTTSIALFFGWLTPASTTLVVAVLLLVWRNVQRKHA